MTSPQHNSLKRYRNIYIYIYIYIYKYIYICIYVYIYLFVCIFIHKYLYIIEKSTRQQAKTKFIGVFSNV